MLPGASEEKDAANMRFIGMLALKVHTTLLQYT